MKPAIADQYNLTIQREIARNTTIQIGYVGQRTTHLMVPIDLDQGDLQSNGTVTYPYIGGLNPIGTMNDRIATTTPTYGPNGLGLVKESASVGNMNYNALQAVLQKRSSNGLEGQVSYTYQKCMANSAGYYGSWGGQSQNADSYWQNLFNPNGDYAQCYWDTKHVLNGYAVYDLPFGRGKQFGHDISTVANAVAGNWAISPSLTWHGGCPLDLRAGDVSGPRTSSRRGQTATAQCLIRRQAYWEENCGSIPARLASQPPGWELSLTRTGHRARIYQYGCQLQKNFPITETMRIQFRADFLNIFNHPNFNAPGTSCGIRKTDNSCAAAPLAMGLITNTQDARQMEFALKFYF